jgi:ABC-type branched-subunit amino acid transport system ATPase component
VLLCEQNLAFARLLGDRAYLLEQGLVRRTGALAEFEDNLPL